MSYRYTQGADQRYSGLMVPQAIARSSFRCTLFQRLCMFVYFSLPTTLRSLWYSSQVHSVRRDFNDVCLLWPS